MTPASKDFPDSFYRVTIKGLCVRDGKLLLIRESESLSGQKWELPGGGLDFGEDIATGFRREIEEEMGLTVVKMSKAPIYVWAYKFENKRNLDWYYACVLAYRVEFADLNITPSDECEAIEFFDVAGLRALKLEGQLTPLADIFNPEDFKDSF
jgi:8-oxo-dGTP pyrophosphatase MutT (NUDIX family)